MTRIKKPVEMRALDPEEIYEPDRIESFIVPAWAEGVQATVGWDGATQSYFFLMVRTAVAHLQGAYDHYLGKRVEVGDIFYAGGRMTGTPIEAEPDMRERIDTLVELIHWTWDEIDWPSADPQVLVKLRDAREREQMITMRDMMESPRTTQSTNWFISAYLDYGAHVDHRF